MLIDMMVSVVDKTNKDAATDASCYKKGDVIDFALSGQQQWSPLELSSPNWRIITVDLTRSAIEALLGPTQATVAARQVPQRRKFFIDLTQLSPSYFQYPWNRAIVVTAAEITNATATRTIAVQV